MVKRVKIAPGGPTFSEIVYGTWRILDEEPIPSPGDLLSRFDACLQNGVTTLDTAEIYGGYHVEQAMGRAFRARGGMRNHFEIVTKCGIDVPSEEKSTARVAHYNATEKNIIACVEKSLTLMGTDRIDLFLVHRPDWLASADETAAGLNKLLKEGKILHAGVSNYTIHEFELLNSRMDKPLVTNQVEVSLLNMGALYDGTLNQCERLRIRPMAWSALGGGRLFDPNDEAAARVRRCMDTIRSRYNGAGYDALAFAWVMAHPSAPLPVIGSNKVERIVSQAQAAEIQMDRQDWYALWEAAMGHHIP